MKTVDANQALCLLFDQEKERIVRLWAKRVLAEVLDVDLPGHPIRKPLSEAVSELHRLLKTRPDKVLTLWPEFMRGHAQVRYAQKFEAEDLVREMKAFQHVLLFMYGKRNGLIEPELTEFITELAFEACASVLSSYTRVLRTEEVRFKEAALMEAILHHVDVGLLLAETDGAIVYATPAVSKLVGLPLKAFLGGEPLVTASLLQMHARHLEGTPYRLADLPYQRVLKSKMAVVGEWMVLRRPTDNQEVILELSATPIFDDSPERKLFGVLQTLIDRTQTAQKNAELSQAYAELRRLQSSLLQRTRVQAFGQLAAGIAHALSNLLHVMRLRLAILKREFRQEHLEALDASIENVANLVVRLRDVSVAREGTRLSVVALEDVVAQALELAQAELPEATKNIEWKIDLASGAQVRADGPLLREVIVNLLVASAQRLSERGIVSVSTRDAGEAVEFCMTDSGPPLPPETLESFFEPWGAAAGHPQMSLLLSLGRSQVRQWGGKLECHNLEDGSGLLCLLRLPKAEATEEEALPREPQVQMAEFPHRIRRVLVVDDDVETARMLAKLLAEEGYVTQSAYSAREAIASWELQPYDAAVLDALMPEESGWELARQLRQRAPHALLAMVTGADVRGQSRFNLSLVDAVFQKPVNIGALEEFLSQSNSEPGAVMH